jgi:hypothetical protein
MPKYIAAAIVELSGFPIFAVGFCSGEQYTRDCIQNRQCQFGTPESPRIASVITHTYFGPERAVDLEGLARFAADNGVKTSRAHI